jgi:glycosyltransferase involved in cell wall biosynthesis
MLEQPLVSFIIPYYNSSNTIEETIQSIKDQTYENYDIWIINDGSTFEESIEKLKLLEKDPSISILHQNNSGPGVARNEAIRLSKAEYIIPLDADDRIHQESVEKAIELIKEKKETGVIYGDLVFFGAKTGTKRQSFKDIKTQFIFNQLAITALIKKQVFEEVGYYDEFLSKPGLEDWEFWMRVAKSNWSIESMNSIFCYVRVDENSRTYREANKNIDLIKEYVYKKHSNLLSVEFSSLFYQNKQILETPDFKIGKSLLKPYRFLKNLLKK